MTRRVFPLSRDTRSLNGQVDVSGIATALGRQRERAVPQEIAAYARFPQKERGTPRIDPPMVEIITQSPQP